MPIFGRGGKKTRQPAGGTTQAPRPPVQAQPQADAGLPEARRIPGDGDSELLRLLKVAETRDWTALRAGVSEYSGNDLTSLIGNICAQSPELSDWLPEAVGPESEDALALAFVGAATVDRAWRVRTTKLAQHVSQDQFREFHEILREAEEHLYRSAELDPKSVAPWHSLLRSGRGLQVGLDIQQRRFEAAAERSPGHLGAHHQMLQQLCRKWSGSHERMHAFATDAMRGPYGEDLGVLIPVAYNEHLISLDKDSPERKFIASAESRAELQEAADRTIFRPGFAPARDPYLAVNTFGWAFCNAGMWPQARAAFEASAGVVAGWVEFTNPVGAYTYQRTLAYKNS
jgi:hypothetical protein